MVILPTVLDWSRLTHSRPGATYRDHSTSSNEWYYGVVSPTAQARPTKNVRVVAFPQRGAGILCTRPAPGLCGLPGGERHIRQGRGGSGRFARPTATTISATTTASSGAVKTSATTTAIPLPIVNYHYRHHYCYCCSCCCYHHRHSGLAGLESAHG